MLLSDLYRMQQGEVQQKFEPIRWLQQLHLFGNLQLPHPVTQELTGAWKADGVSSPNTAPPNCMTTFVRVQVMLT